MGAELIKCAGGGLVSVRFWPIAVSRPKRPVSTQSGHALVGSLRIVVVSERPEAMV